MCVFLFVGDACNLFAFPSECNFSGSRFSLDLVKLIKEDSERILKGFPFCKYASLVVLVPFSFPLYVIDVLLLGGFWEHIMCWFNCLGINTYNLRK